MFRVRHLGQFRPVIDFLTATGFSTVNLLYKYDLVTSDYLDTHEPARSPRHYAKPANSSATSSR